jgi:glycosyl transferase family 25
MQKEQQVLSREPAAGSLSNPSAVENIYSGVATYVINLDRSVDRWKHMDDQATLFGLSIERVAAIDGAQIDTNQRKNYKHEAFVRGNGRPMLPEEYGCYLAHLKALQTFLAGNAECAVILEDDVDLQQDFVRRAEGIRSAAPFADVVKLLNHRALWFRPFARSHLGDLVGKCFFGPQGSAACYLVTRYGAERLLIALQEIRFPFDVALERGWETEVQVYSVKKNVLELSVRSRESQIADRAKYRSIKLSSYRRIPTHAFRILEFFRRVRYGL